MARASSTEHEQLLDDYEALWNGDLSKLDVVAESVDVYDPAHPHGEVHGREEFETFLRQIHGAFPDFELTKDPEETIASEDTLMGTWTLSGTSRGSFFGVPPTGRSVTIQGMSKISIADGKVEEDRIYFNERELLDQLGLTFPDIVPLVPKLAWGKLRGTL